MRITISLDAARPELYETVRVGANYQRVLGNVKTLIAQRRERHQQRPLVRVMLVPTNRNVTEIADLAQVCSELGIDELVVSRFNPPAPELAELECAETTLQSEVSRAERRARQLGIKFRSEIMTSGGTASSRPVTPKCFWPWYSLNILVDGTVTPCANVANSTHFALGNALAEGFDSIWNGECYRRLRHAHRTASLQHTPCKEWCRNFTI